MVNPLMGMAGIGLIVGLWNNIKLWASKVISLFIITVDIDDYNLSRSLAIHIVENYKCSLLGKKRYRSMTEYVKPIKRTQMVSFEMIPHEKTLWWEKEKFYKFMFVSKQDSNISISFFRWTYNTSKLIEYVTKQHNSELIDTTNDWRSNNRFYVIKRYGSIGKAEKSSRDIYGKGSGNSSVEAPVMVSNNDDKRTMFPLGWTRDEIGQPEDNSPISNLSLKQEHLDVLKEAIRWRDSETWFKERSIPWKRGLLLHGTPGTGKTAFVRALAQELKMPIVSFDLATMTNQDFNEEWNNTIGCYQPCICLFEDFDGIFHGRENIAVTGKNNNGISFDNFLNTLDGVNNTDGIFVVITTNNISLLDNAIGVPNNGDGMSTRPGRIDRTIKFDSLTKDGMEKMANRILGDRDKSLWDGIVDVGLQHNDTGAQFQERCCRVALDLFWRSKDTI